MREGEGPDPARTRLLFVDTPVCVYEYMCSVYLMGFEEYLAVKMERVVGMFPERSAYILDLDEIYCYQRPVVLALILINGALRDVGDGGSPPIQPKPGP